MKAIKKILFLILITLCFSCEEVGLFDCADCLEEQPITGNIEIKLSSSSGSITINVYEGNLEEKILYKSISTTKKNVNISVVLNKKYTVTAVYTKSFGNQEITVDSAYPRVRYDQDQCDDPCYFIFDNEVNLRMKII